MSSLSGADDSGSMFFKSLPLPDQYVETPLHVSLSRFFSLTADQVDGFVSSLRGLLGARVGSMSRIGNFKVSLEGCQTFNAGASSIIQTDDYRQQTAALQARVFIGPLVGQGREQILRLIRERIDAAMAEYSLPAFYEPAEPHVSIAVGTQLLRPGARCAACTCVFSSHAGPEGSSSSGGVGELQQSRKPRGEDLAPSSSRCMSEKADGTAAAASGWDAPPAIPAASSSSSGQPSAKRRRTEDTALSEGDTVAVGASSRLPASEPSLRRDTGSAFGHAAGDAAAAVAAAPVLSGDTGRGDCSVVARGGAGGEAFAAASPAAHASAAMGTQARVSASSAPAACPDCAALTTPIGTGDYAVSAADVGLDKLPSPTFTATEVCVKVGKRLWRIPL